MLAWPMTLVTIHQHSKTNKLACTACDTLADRANMVHQCEPQVKASNHAMSQHCVLWRCSMCNSATLQLRTAAIRLHHTLYSTQQSQPALLQESFTQSQPCLGRFKFGQMPAMQRPAGQQWHAGSTNTRKPQLKHAHQIAALSKCTAPAPSAVASLSRPQAMESNAGPRTAPVHVPAHMLCPPRCRGSIEELPMQQLGAPATLPAAPPAQQRRRRGAQQSPSRCR